MSTEIYSREILMKKNVLILTSDMGMGHRSAANAVHAALQQTYGDSLNISVVNPMTHPKVPSFYKDNPNAYDLVVKNLPELYQLTYKAADNTLSSVMLENTNTVMLIEAMWLLLRQHKPDVIVVTRENYLSTLWALFTLTRKHIPVITVVTDLGTVHRMWFNSVSDVTCVPNQRVYDIGMEHANNWSSLKITGIPVHPRLANEHRSPQDLRTELGWRQDLTTFLVVGGTRVRNVLESVRVLNHSNQPIQVVVVAGGDDAVFKALQNYEWHIPAEVYHFVNNMPQLLLASDVLVCKAGGLMVTEGLAAGLPILLIDAIEGQETGNVEYVEDNGAGIMARTGLDLLEAVHHWMMDGETLLRLSATRAQQSGYPNSALEISRLVYQYAIGELMAGTDRDEQEERFTQPLRDFIKRLNLFFD
jgi:UDP-N-acetylglucosamine:LPS N-acetylglucosamine transferase